MPGAVKGGASAAPMVLTQKTYKKFENGSKSGSVIVVLHHMIGCPHCDMIRPAWSEAVRRAGPSAGIAEMSYDPMWIPNEMSDVRGFPTIRAYSNGKAIAEYQGDRTAASIVGFIGATATPAKPAAAAPKTAAKKTAKTVKKPSAPAPKKRASAKA
jgi:thiol-disulfide isomerase/thioredoxin